MNPFGVRRYRQIRQQYAVGILVCFCLFWLVGCWVLPAGCSQKKQDDQSATKAVTRAESVRASHGYIKACVFGSSKYPTGLMKTKPARCWSS